MKRILAGLPLLLVASAAGFAQSKPRPAPAHRVVIEINAPDRNTWGAALKNIVNLQRSFGVSNFAIEAVVLGKGIDLVLRSDARICGRLRSVSHSGVIFAACQNTMRQRNLTDGDLLDFVITVDSGVAELVRKQESGWAYLEAGS
jgi:intracellular sulfur oxidation DsrE/DsrF family protein